MGGLVHCHTIKMRMRHDCTVVKQPLDGARNSLIDWRPRDAAVVDSMDGNAYGIKVVFWIDKRVPFRQKPALLESGYTDRAD